MHLSSDLELLIEVLVLDAKPTIFLDKVDDVRVEIKDTLIQLKVIDFVYGTCHILRIFKYAHTFSRVRRL